MREDDLNRLAEALAPAIRRHIPEGGHHHSDERRDVNVERSGVWMDYKTLVGVAIAVSVMTWWGAGQFTTVQYELRELRTLLTQIPKQFDATLTAAKETLSERIARLEVERLRYINSPDHLSRTAHDLWCLETERVNRSIGWQCGSMPGGVRRQTQIEQPQDYYPQWSTETTKKERAKP
jgi:hypothetical protein